MDVPNGDVLFALPALLAAGLLKYTERYFQLPKGYYGLASLFVLLAFLALARIKTIELVRYCAPGEWGKLLGLDRIPEVSIPQFLVYTFAHCDRSITGSANGAALSQPAATPQETDVKT